jgi:hypothetical protein
MENPRAIGKGKLVSAKLLRLVRFRHLAIKTQLDCILGIPTGLPLNERKGSCMRDARQVDIHLTYSDAQAWTNLSGSSYSSYSPLSPHLPIFHG